MKAAAFLLAFVAVLLVKGSVSEVGVGSFTKSLQLHGHLNKDAVSTAAERTESQGDKRRSLRWLSQPAPQRRTRVFNEKDIEGIWVGFVNPAGVSDSLGNSVCPAEAKRRGVCYDNPQIKLEIDGGKFAHRLGPSGCQRCGSTGEERINGKVLSFRNNRLEFKYQVEDISVEGWSSKKMEDIFGKGSRDACIEMKVNVANGKVMANTRLESSIVGTPERYMEQMSSVGMFQCYPQSITCESTFTPSYMTQKTSQSGQLQCIAGKCLELAGPNAKKPTNLDPCFQNLASEMNASHSNLVALWAITFVALILAYSLLEL